MYNICFYFAFYSPEGHINLLMKKQINTLNPILISFFCSRKRNCAVIICQLLSVSIQFKEYIKYVSLPIFYISVPEFAKMELAKLVRCAFPLQTDFIVFTILKHVLKKSCRRYSCKKRRFESYGGAVFDEYSQMNNLFHMQASINI